MADMSLAQAQEFQRVPIGNLLVAAFSRATVHAAKADTDHWLDAVGSTCAISHKAITTDPNEKGRLP